MAAINLITLIVTFIAEPNRVGDVLDLTDHQQLLFGDFWARLAIWLVLRLPSLLAPRLLCGLLIGFSLLYASLSGYILYVAVRTKRSKLV